MNPYYEDDHTTIYRGDCLEVLDRAGIAFDCVITDPPFSSGARTDAGTSIRGSMVRGRQWRQKWFTHDNLATLGFLFLMRLLGVRLLSRAKAAASCHLFIDWRMFPNLYGALESSGWIVKNLIVWDKQDFGMGANYRNQHELIIYAEKGRVQFKRHDVGNVLQAKRARCDLHPTEKPVDLLKKLISTTVETDGQIVNDAIILDPFCGSGSTLIAAKQMGLRSIGIEIQEEFCEIAANRARQDYLCAF